MRQARVKVDQFVSIASRSASLLLLLAIGHWPYAYYVLLRWIVFAMAVLVAGTAIARRRLGSLLLFIPVGLVFNPFVPVFLTRGIWFFIDIAAAVLITIGAEEVLVK